MCEVCFCIDLISRQFLLVTSIGNLSTLNFAKRDFWARSLGGGR